MKKQRLMMKKRKRLKKVVLEKKVMKIRNKMEKYEK